MALKNTPMFLTLETLQADFHTLILMLTGLQNYFYFGPGLL